MKKFNIGDVVVIKNTGKVYSTYQDWADLYNLNNFVKHKSPSEGIVVTVTCVGYQGLVLGLILYGVTDGKNDYIIGEGGLEKHVVYEWQWLVEHSGWFTTSYFYKTKEELESILTKSGVKVVSRIEESKREVGR